MLDNIKKLFRISDVFLVIWVTFGILILLEQFRFINYTSANLLELSKPFYVFVIYFILMILSLVFYLFFESKNHNLKLNKIVVLLFFFIIVLQAENIFLTPNTIIYYIVDLSGDPFMVSAEFNVHIKCIHFFTLCFIMTTIFIAIFIFSKRITNVKTISYVIYLSYILAFIFLIYSFINDNYPLLFRVLTLQEVAQSIKDVSPISVFGNSNVYGMFLEVCLYLSFINYSITKKKLNIVVSFLLYINLLLTICKAGIFATMIVIPLLILIKAILNLIGNHRRRGLLQLLSFVLIVSFYIGIFIFIKTSEDYQFVLGEYKSLSGRTNFWNSFIQIIGFNSFVYGCGFGIYSSLVANTCGHFSLENCPYSHNSYIAMLGDGGFIYIICFSSFLIYTTLLMIKNIRRNNINIPLLIGVYGFFVHMMFEDNYYILISFMVLALVVNNIYKELTSKQTNWEIIPTKIR